MRSGNPESPLPPAIEVRYRLGQPKPTQPGRDKSGHPEPIPTVPNRIPDELLAGGRGFVGKHALGTMIVLFLGALDGFLKILWVDIDQKRILFQFTKI